MWLKLLTTLLAVASVGAVPTHEVHELYSRAKKNANAAISGLSKRNSSSCTDPYTRVEWRTLNATQQEEYVAAALCLQSKPARLLGDAVPGAKSRFDDFVAVHINQTLIIHYTATFLAWHRYFTYLYETALREECGYTGYQPYWEWSLDAVDPTKSPIFAGTPNSMGSNGAYIANRSETNLGGGTLPDLFLPAGTGGGCAYSGPFTNMSVNLGPIDNPFLNQSSTDLFRYNPRCLKRDLNPYVSNKWLNWTDISSLLSQPDIYNFEYTMQGFPGSGELGVHGGGHYSFGLDPGGDFYNSPGDPVFYLHHGQIDRMWWTWQNLDLEDRQYAINGTSTFLNDPPSPEVQLNDTINWGILNDGPLTMESLMSTVAGPFCYTYA